MRNNHTGWRSIIFRSGLRRWQQCLRRPQVPANAGKALQANKMPLHTHCKRGLMRGWKSNTRSAPCKQFPQALTKKHLRKTNALGRKINNRTGTERRKSQAQVLSGAAERLTSATSLSGEDTDAVGNWRRRIAVLQVASANFVHVRDQDFGAARAAAK